MELVIILGIVIVVFILGHSAMEVDTSLKNKPKCIHKWSYHPQTGFLVCTVCGMDTKDTLK